MYRSFIEGPSSDPLPLPLRRLRRKTKRPTPTKARTTAVMPTPSPTLAPWLKPPAAATGAAEVSSASEAEGVVAASVEEVGVELETGVAAEPEASEGAGVGVST